MRNTTLALVLLTVAAVPPAGCAGSGRVQTETTLAKILVSDAQAESIGQQVHAELEKQGVRYVRDTTVNSYVESVARRIFELAKKDRPGVNYHVHVIDDPKTANAFATPGGHIYVHSGLLLTASNEAELAGVLGHETGHVTGRHVERAMVNAFGLQALAQLALGQNPSAAAEMAAGLAGTGLLRAHSRSEEIEADEYGARYTAAVGYDPNALITFFQKLQQNEGRSSRVMGWLSTHPVTSERISNLRQYIAEKGLRGGTLNAERHRSIQSRLAG
jgi:predicted Zn-dependent protease